LAETESDGVQKATRENVQRALGDFRRRLSKDDQLLVLLIGHGTSLDGDEAKFNLVGPDLTASEWADLVKPIPGRVVFVNTTGAGIGREVQNPSSTDGAVARTTYIEPEAPLAIPTDAAQAALVRRRADLESQLEELKARKEQMPPDQYDAELEKILVEIARIGAQLRTKS